MNCESASKQIPLYFYGELPPEDEDSLEQHLDACAGCARLADGQRRLWAVLERREMKPSDALVDDCRAELMRSIEGSARPLVRAAEPRKHWFPQEWFSWASAGSWRMPIGASAMLAVGFLAARFTAPGAVGDPFTSAGLISSVRSVQPAADGAKSGEVRIVVDETRQRVISGRLNDNQIQQLIVAAAHEQNNPAVRYESVNVLTGHSDATRVRELLLNRVREDPNTGVRLKALEGLKPYATDSAVRSVLEQVLLHDQNPAVRIAVVDTLTAHANDAMVGVLQSVVQKEGNGYVRSRCERTLKDLNASVGTF